MTAKIELLSFINRLTSRVEKRRARKRNIAAILKNLTKHESESGVLMVQVSDHEVYG